MAKAKRLSAVLFLIVIGIGSVWAETPVTEIDPFVVVKANDALSLRQWLAQDGDPNLRGKGTTTLLHIAVLSRSSDCVRVLLEHGAVVDATSDFYGAPLRWVQDVTSASYLIAAGADVNAIDREGDSLLDLWVKLGKPQSELVRLLIESGANIEHRNARGETPIHAAASFGSWEAFSLLLDKGADAHSVDCNGRTSLHSAAEGGNIKIAKKLINSGLDVNATDEGGYTPLHIAAHEGLWEMVDLLIAHGAEIAQKDKSGRNALHLAVIGEHWDPDVPRNRNWDYCKTIRILIRKGMDVHAKDDEGKTPIEHVSEDVFPNTFALIESARRK